MICVLVTLYLTVLTVAREVPLDRIAFGSCYNPDRGGGEMWRLIHSFAPDQLILLGDQFYADMRVDFSKRKSNLSVITEEYNKFTTDKEWIKLSHSVKSWSATFDDHDYGMNNGDKMFRHRNASQDLFWQFVGSSPFNERGERKSGVYSSRTVSVDVGGGAHSPFVYKIILLDSRSNKDPAGTKNGDFLGAEQWNWLAEQLMDPAPQLLLVGSSIQALPDDKLVEENWGEFPRARERLLRLLAAASLSPGQDVVLLSGDIHSAELSQARLTLSTHRHDRRSRGATGDNAGGEDALAEATLSEQVLLRELTSSGLSHTFTKTTALEAKVPGSYEVPERSRTALHEAVFALYQVSMT